MVVPWYDSSREMKLTRCDSPAQRKYSRASFSAPSTASEPARYGEFNFDNTNNQSQCLPEHMTYTLPILPPVLLMSQLDNFSAGSFSK